MKAYPPSFVALDFELANHHHASIDSVGVTRVTDGEVGPPKQWYVRPAPPYDFITAFNHRLTGIHPNHLRDAAGFDHRGPILMDRIAGGVIVAHGATSADLSMFEQSWFGVNLGPFPAVDFVCTQVVARQTLPGLPSYKLNDLYEHVFGEPMGGSHHDAGDDARATALLLNEMLARSGTPLHHWVRQRHARPVRPLNPVKRRNDDMPLPPRRESATSPDMAVA